MFQAYSIIDKIECNQSQNSGHPILLLHPMLEQMSGCEAFFSLALIVVVELENNWTIAITQMHPLLITTLQLSGLMYYSVQLKFVSFIPFNFFSPSTLFI